MSRIIDEELFAQLVKILAQDEKVAVFRQLVLAPKLEPTEITPEDVEKSEVK